MEAHNGTKLTIEANPEVEINYTNGGIASFNSDPKSAKFGILRKIYMNSYILSGQ